MVCYLKSALYAYLLAPVLVVGYLGGSVAVAQQLEEVIVSAQKREQLLSQVSMSLMSLDGDALVASGAKNISAVAEKVPNFTFDESVTLSGSSLASSIYIRGIGQSDFLMTTDPGVGLYLDDVYISRSVGSLLNLVDIERVEVLRGPQGTLYGKSTIGGAIKIVTRKPQEDNFVRSRVTTGNDRRREAVVTVNRKLSNQVNANVSLGGYWQDGYIQRPAAGDALGEEDSWTARVTLDVVGGKDFSAFFAADISRANEAAGAATLVDTFELCPFGVSAPFCDDNAPAGTPPGQAFLFNNVPPITIQAGGVPGTDRYDNQWVPDNIKMSYGTAEAVSEVDVRGLQSTLIWKLPSAKVKSITAYRSLESYFTRDADHSPFTIYHTTADIKQNQFSQELQLSGLSLSERLHWLGGLYFLREQAEDDSKLYLASLDIQSGGSDIQNTSLAGFFNSSFLINNNWTLNLGGRHTQEKKSYLPNQYIAYSHPALVPPQPPTGSIVVPADKNKIDFSNTSYRLGLDYTHMPNVLIYGSLASGFKSGGFVQRNQVPQTELPRFKPEFSTTLEIGFRAKLWQQRMHMNTALFHTEYDDIQVRVIEVAGFAPITANAAAAKISGLEWDMSVALTDALDFSAAVGLLDARYTSVGNDLSDITLASKFVNSPKVSSAIGLQHRAILNNANLNSCLDWAHRSEVYNDAENTDLLKQKATDLLNASLQYAVDDSGWKVTVGINNLLDEEIIVSGNANRSLGSVVASYQRGRSWYLIVEWII